MKPGLLLSPGASYAGVVDLVGIGLAGDLPNATVGVLDAVDVGVALPRPVAT